MITIVLCIVALWIIVDKPFLPELRAEGHFAIAGVLVALPLWILTPGGLPRSIGSLIMLAIFLFAGWHSFYSGPGYCTTALWILIPALFYGTALVKTGLGRRIAFYILRVCGTSRLGITIGFVLIALILSGFTPSCVGRLAIVMPITFGMIRIMGFEPRSANAAYLGMLAWIWGFLPGAAWYTGNLAGPIVRALLPPEVMPEIGSMVVGPEGVYYELTWWGYTRVNIVPFLLLGLFLIPACWLATRPKPFPSIPIAEEYQKLGPMTREEKIALIVLVLSLAGWLCGTILEIDASVVCLTGFFALFAFRVLDFWDIGRIAWDLIIWIGGVLGIAWVFTAAGVTTWLEPKVGPLLQPIAGNIFVFVTVLFLVFCALRFIDVTAGLVLMGITFPFTPMLYHDFGIHPLVFGTVAMFAAFFFLMHYMNLFALIGNDLIRGEGWTESHLRRCGIGYIIVGVIALLISVFYWKAIGVVV